MLGGLVMITEQQTNLKFLVRLGKSTTEALSMLQQMYKEQTLFRATVFCGIKESKKDLRMIPGAEDLQPVEIKPMLS